MTQEEFDARYSVARNSFSGAWYVRDNQERLIEAGPWREERKAHEVLAFMRQHVAA